MTLSKTINDVIKDLPADEAVVEKWKIIREFVLNNNIEKKREEISDAMLGETCAYCRKFNKGPTIDCDGCPIKEKTKLKGCRGTPWEECHTALYLTPEENKQTLIRHIDREIEFLKSLGRTTEYPECQESYQIELFAQKLKVINTRPKDNQVYINQNFVSGSVFGNSCYFIRCEFEDEIAFGNGCVFSANTLFGNGCVFGNNTMFGGWCVFGNDNLFKVCTTFGNHTTFGNNNTFDEFTRFGRNTTFGKNCFIIGADGKKRS